MHPLKFKPNLKTVVWGGDRITAFKGIQTTQSHIGESWEISAMPGKESVIANGVLAGKTLTEVCGKDFPLLLKFIDAQGDLSIQVHPNDELAIRRHGSHGKDEMWYVIDAEPGACLYCGLKRQITPEEYTRLVEENRITEVLQRFEAKAGDVFWIPAGRIHAICAGCLIAEIQHSSDITYRIWDYGRLGLDGKPRELHTGLAKDAIDYNMHSDYRITFGEKLNEEVGLVSCNYFTTSILEIDKPFRKDLTSDASFLTVMCIEGSGEIIDNEPEGDEKVTFRQGESILIPETSTGITFNPSTTSKLLISKV